MFWLLKFLLVVLVLFVGIFIFRKIPALSNLVIKVHKFTAAEKASVKGKVIVVTGGTDGIGKVFVQEMYKNGAIVIFSGRSIEKAKDIFEGLSLNMKSSSDMIADVKDSLIFKRSEFSDLDEVQNFCDFVIDLVSQKNYGRIDHLFNNAGFYDFDYRQTKQGFDSTFGVNFISHVITTHRLLDLIKQSKDPRIVFTSSFVQRYTTAEKCLQPDNPKSISFSFYSYSKSKMANAVIARVLSKMHPKILFFSFHPGVVHTGIMRNFPAWLRVIIPYLKFIIRAPYEGAQSMLKIAYSSRVDLLPINGCYFDDNGEVEKIQGEQNWSQNWLQSIHEKVAINWKNFA